MKRITTLSGKKSIFHYIRKYRRFIAAFFILFLLLEIFQPTTVLALTGGPSTPEVNAPSKLSFNNLVDPFTGNLNYNISLMKVGDYPLSLSYNADVTMDQEATWVGLGWTLNPGVINRSVRGLPDDFKGDEVERTFNVKPMVKAGLNAGLNLELFGIDAPVGGGLSLSLGLFYDNYYGVGLSHSIAPSISVATGSKGHLTASLGVNKNSQKNGTSVSPSLSYSQQMKTSDNSLSNGGISIGASFNSLSGLKSININGGKKSHSYDFQGSFDSFTDDTFKPEIQFPMHSVHGAFSFAAGGEIFGTYGSGSLTGYYSVNKLKTNTKKVDGYGYAYTHYAKEDIHALLDFKREKDGQFEARQPNLPVPNYTYDIFQMSGSGIGGSFRIHRGDVGMVYDSKTVSKGGDQAVPAVGGLNLSGEIGAGNLTHIGIDIKSNGSQNSSGLWAYENEIKQHVLPVKPENAASRDYEPFYFKLSGEKSVVNNASFYNSILNRGPASIVLSDATTGKALSVLQNNGNSNTLSGLLHKTKREKRLQVISYLTAVEAKRMALNRKLLSYPQNTSPLGNPQITKIDRLDGSRKKHHFSQISIRNNNGRNYIYGIPAYNTKKQEVAFNTKSTSADCKTGLVSYNDTENSTDNKRGLNNYYTKTSTPAYAYSYLLSAIVSDDYQDLTGDGPSEDDLGTYTRFNYTRTNKNYRWRTPYKRKRANFQENHYSKDNDNMVTYVYGEKEIWYMHSIETRNYVAEFTVSDRNDGCGVQDEDGGRDKSKSQTLKKLDKITLYSKAERKSKGKNAVPLKTVHFVYDYSLCKNIPNHKQKNNKDNGKLTLKEIYFTYGKSKKGRFSPYKFTYSNVNPDYEQKANNRFGFYKPNDCSGFPNAEFPYVDQDISKTGRYVNAWKLKHIRLPSGGKVSIDYEPDDYAFVQDRHAMQMCGIAGLSDSPTGNRGNKLYSNVQKKGTMIDFDINDHLFVKLPQPVSSKQELDRYFRNVNNLYFKCKLDVIGTGKNDPSDHFEYISGFIEYEAYGLDQSSKSNGQYSRAWIRLKKVEMGDFKLMSLQKKTNPIAKRAFTYSKYNLAKYAFNRTDATNKLTSQLGDALGSLGDFMKMFKSLNALLAKRRFAQKIKKDKSMIRLYNPHGKKLGGGHRVKRIVYSDMWADMTNSQPSSRYGHVYEYETTSDEGNTISSGVIPYEPMVGADENPLYQPVFYKHNGDQLHMVKPFGESFYPGSTVGYSRVKISSLPYPNTKAAPAGYSVKEFYTAKDFPVRTERTRLQDKRTPTKPLAQLNPFKLHYEEIRALSQGYMIETNDMHGKEKANYIYRHGSNTPLKGTEYKYLVDQEGRLKNSVSVLDKNSRVKDAVVGVDIDFVVDSREQHSVVTMQGINMNSDMFMVAIAPVLIPIPLPALKLETVTFRTMATSKVVQRRGIIDEIIAYDNGAKLSSKNLLYDSETGRALISKSENELGDYTYQTRMAAHYQYEGMGGAYQNCNAIFKDATINNGEFTDNGIAALLHDGDVLYWEDTNDKTKYNKAWVLNNRGNNKVIIDHEGKLVPDGSYNIKIIRSGFANMTGKVIGTITSLDNPVQGNSVSFNNVRVLSAKATKHKEHWQTYLAYNIRHEPARCVCSKIEQTKGAGLITVMREINLRNRPVDTLSAARSAKIVLRKMNSNADMVIMHQQLFGNRLTTYFTEPGSNEQQCTFRLETKNGIPFPENGTAFSNFQYVDKDPYTCDSVFNFTVDYGYQDETGTKRTITLDGYSECFAIATCNEKPLKTYKTCNLVVGDIINPFFNGIKGNWRPYQAFTLTGDRQGGKIDQAGHLSRFTPFRWNGKNSNDWVWRAKSTIIDPFNKTLEQQDPFGNYKAEIPGYSYTLVKSRILNGKLRKAGFDGFEDYTHNKYMNSLGGCGPLKHFRFKVPRNMQYATTGAPVKTTAFINNNVSHTGHFSATATPNTPLINKISIGHIQTGGSGSQGKQYVLQKSDLIYNFAPGPGRYFISVWAQDKTQSNTFGSVHYDKPKIEIDIDGTNTETFRPTGPIIDDWQQINGRFSIPQNAQYLTIRLASDSGTVYFDDFRVHPDEAQMEAFVYDPFTLDHRATLDMNNFAVFYQYDESGQLVSVKKESAEGIVTQKESRKSKFKLSK